jgi:hypothetical protein
MQNTFLRTRLRVALRLIVCAACFAFAAHGGPLTFAALTAQVGSGPVVNSTTSTSWGAAFPFLSATSSGDTWEYGDTSLSGIFLVPSTASIFGLTNSEFRCGLTNPGGCAALAITFNVLGVPASAFTASGTIVIGLDGSTTFSGPLQSLYFVSDSGPFAIPLSAPTGAISLSTIPGPFSGSNAGTPVVYTCPSCPGSGSLINLSVTLLIEPSTPGARFLDGDTITLPSSFSVAVSTPEPAGAVIAGLGLAALGVWRRVR